MPTKPVLISGGGLAALLLAQSLHTAKIPFLLFERDASLTFRAQGYRLRLSKEGLAAIESALGPEAWQRFYDTTGKTAGAGVIAYNALTGEVVERPDGVQNPAAQGATTIGIARGDMRRLFAEGLPPGSVHFSKQVNGYELTADGVHAIFTDGTKSVEGSMLVGGEGIYSKVAKQLSGGRLKVFDTGSRGIHGQAPTTAFKALGEGVFAMRDESTALEGGVTVITNVRAKDMDDPNIQFGWTMIGYPGVIRAPNDDYAIVGQQAADIAKRITKEWHPRFKPLFDEMNASESAFWKITCSSPSGVPEWPNEPRVTLIGDAVHSMTPAAGLGANTAVRDSALLGKLLAQAGGYEPGITAAYEKEMRVYGSEAVAQSYGSASKIFGAKIDEETTATVN